MSKKKKPHDKPEDQQKTPAAEVAVEAAPAVEASCSDQDFQKHPKFAKFKTLEGEN